MTIPFPVAHWGGGVPAAPSALTATPVTPTQVFLQWRDNSDGETSFRIHRSTVPFLPGPGTEVGFAPPNATNFPDTTAEPATTYFYRVVARNEYGDSPPSNEAQVTTPVVTNPPPAPSNLVVTPLGTLNSISWQDNSQDDPHRATEFDVEVSTDNGASWSHLATVPYDPGQVLPTQYQQNHSPLTPDTRHVYRVRARNAGGASDYSNTGFGFSRPHAPSGLVATAISATHIDLSWQDNSSIEQDYRVHRSTSPGFTPSGANLRATLPAGTTSLQDTVGLSPDTTYYYKVIARNQHGNESAPSNQASATTPALPTLPTVSGLTVDADTALNRARAHFGVGASTESVAVWYEIIRPAGGISLGEVLLEIIDTTPNGTGYTSSWTPQALDGDEIIIHCRPWTGNNATGTQGAVASQGTGPL